MIGPNELHLVPGIHVTHSDANKWAITLRGFDRYVSNRDNSEHDWHPVQAGVRLDGNITDSRCQQFGSQFFNAVLSALARIKEGGPGDTSKR